MLRYIMALLLLGAGLLMLRTAIKYMRLIKAARPYIEKDNRLKHARIYRVASILIMVIFISSYLVGAADFFFSRVEGIYYYNSIGVILAAVFMHIMVTYLTMIVESLKTKSDRLTEVNDRLTAKVNNQFDELLYNLNVLAITNEMATILFGSDMDEFEKELNLALAKLAKVTGVQNIYIARNVERKDGQYYEPYYVWPEQSFAGQAEKPVHAYSETLPGWLDKFRSGLSINGPVEDLTDQARTTFEKYGIHSVLAQPVFIQNELWGFVEYLDRSSGRYFTEAEMGILRSASMLMVSSIHQMQMMENLVKTKEEAVKSTEAKGQFLSNMSHEIRTPINAILGMVRSTRKAKDQAALNDSLGKIETAGKQLLGIVNDILDMSKIEAGKMELVEDDYDLRELLMNLKSIVGVTAADKDQEVEIDVGPRVPRAVYGDGMRLSQVLLNLLSNAVKFTDKGGHIKISARCLGQEGENYNLRFTVEDNGIGIAPEKQENLFESFEQAEKTTVKRFGGTGLGLAISKMIVQLMGGTIRVESELGQGSTFIIEVPIRQGDEEKLDKSRDETVEMTLDLHDRRALVVEDIDINREIMAMALDETKIQVEEAGDGQEACDKFAAHPERYDIIFMDIHMPVMDGYTATEKIRSMDFPWAQQVPIIAMTANAFTEDIEHCLRVGMNNHLAKPLEVDKLFAVLAKYVTE